MSCFTGAILSALLVGVGDTMHFIPFYSDLVLTGWPVLDSARAEGSEELSMRGWAVLCPTESPSLEAFKKHVDVGPSSMV